MRTPLVCLIVSLAALGPGCTTSATERELETNRALFTQANRTSYAFTWRASCFCTEEATLPIRISVAGPNIVSAVYVDGREPVSDLVRSQLKTIEGVFDLIQTRLDEGADEVAVTYDATLAYPTSVFIDVSSRAIDEELSLDLSDFMSPANVP